MGKGDVNIIKNSLPEDGFSIVGVSNVRKSYVLGGIEIHVLSDVNIKIERKEFLAIKSPSSSGKSTSVNLVGCLGRYTKGHVLVRYMDLNRMSDPEFANLQDLIIDFIFRRFNLAPRLTAIQNILLSTFTNLRISIDTKKRARKSFEIMELHGHTHQRSRELSESQPEGISITNALISDHTILFADKIIRCLDSRTFSDIFCIFPRLNMKSGFSIITANNREITKCAGSVYQIKDRITQYN
ncbi:MAG TPA: ATP-binding cassette domain-containing protein [Methanosarcina sp.]